MIDQTKKLRELMREHQGLSADAATSHRGTPGVRTCKSIAVTSGKGGVGKSNLSLMLSIALAQHQKRVLLLDADLGLANIHILIGTAPKRNISHLLDDQCLLEDVIVEGPAGIHILPGASGLESLANIEPLRLEMLHRKLSALEQRYDFMLIDTGAGIGRTTTSFAGNADLGLLVLTPEPTSLADAYAMVKVLYEKNIADMGVLVNMAMSEKEGREVFDKLNALVVRFLHKPLILIDIVPTDPEIPRSVKRQKVLLIDQPHRASCVHISAAARRLGGMPMRADAGFFSRLFGR